MVAGNQKNVSSLSMAEWRNWHTQLLQVQPSKEMWVQVPPQLPKLHLNWQIANVTYIKLPDSARMAKALSVLHIFELIFSPLS